MTIQLRENQYRGINAHLHSLLQSEGGGWESFHNAHIINLTEAIDLLLPEGYYVLNEKSLQLSGFNPNTGELKRIPTRPDVGIYGKSEMSHRAGSPAGSKPTAVIPVIDTLIEDEQLPSVVIFKVENDKTSLPVTRIELLSPANKPPGAHYLQYLVKRTETLKNGINLVELDYLHETRSPIRVIPSYPDHEPDAYPYMILVSEVRASLAEAQMAVYGFFVDEPIPVVTIPLSGQDTITVDFGAVYNVTFSRNRYYGTVAVDYDQVPVRFGSYSETDQKRIRERMEMIKTASQS